MTEDEIKNHLEGLNGWSVVDGKLEKQYMFENFVESISFVKKIAEIAEKEGHHPDIEIFSYKNVRVKLWTHAILGLSINDFILAAKIGIIAI